MKGSPRNELLGDLIDEDEGLTKEEDNALRQLAFFEMAGDLSASARQRKQDLRNRDRRTDVRNPRPDPSAD
jgi:hypothetical protein